ncbi:MAG: CPBP family intramembrane metalloprotease [Tannerella sp.]|nr:CPBP family intramembrane metalloprotease [Tannerella sp.]
MKGIFAGRSVLFQVGVLAAMMLTSFLMASAVSFMFTVAMMLAGAGTDSAAYTQCVQLLASVLVFLFPAVATAWLCSVQPATFIGLGRVPGVRLSGWIAVATLLLSPAISLAGHFNMQMQLPEFMAPLEQFFREAERTAEEMFAKMIGEGGLLSWLVNIVVMAVAAAVCEEFFFRGALLGILRRKMRNPHVVIWLVAFIFSAIHFQFYGFVPRMLLGAFMGYLLLWTGSIWAPVFAHFLNNAMAVTGMSSRALKDSALFANELNADDMVWFSVVAVIALAGFFGCLWGIKFEVRNSKFKI